MTVVVGVFGVWGFGVWVVVFGLFVEETVSFFLVGFSQAGVELGVLVGEAGGIGVGGGAAKVEVEYCVDFVEGE